MELVSFRSR